jgi:C-terminal processing protease CtpA/Prc
MRVVTAYLSELKDSHAYLLPPQRSVQMDYGYELEEIGDACFAAHVEPNTDAAAKLHPGDQVLKLDGYLVTREDFHALQRYRLSQAQLNGTVMTIRTPAGDERELRISASEHPFMPYIGQDRWAEMMRRWEASNDQVKREVVESGDVALWKLPQFNLASDWVDKQIAKARKHKALILDLRGDSGGLNETLVAVTGSLFDHDVKIGDRVERDSTKPLIAKHASHPFDGKVIVLVDDGSASASEIVARVVQLEHRGTVIGDRSAGAVMGAITHSETAQGALFGLSITFANLIMTDGKSLEGTGVVPDEILLPTAADLAAGRDPVLAHAVELAGSKMDPVAAGKLFPYEWPKFK